MYAVATGLLLGRVLGGRLSGLASIQFHWPWLAIGGFAIQLALFSDTVSNAVGYAGPAIYVASTFAVRFCPKYPVSPSTAPRPILASSSRPPSRSTQTDSSPSITT